MELKNKVALVTGAGRGIGKALVEMLAAEGCLCAGAARSKNELKELEEKILKSGGRIKTFCMDLGELKNAEGLVDKVVKEFGGLDILVNNAGILINRPFLEVTMEELDQTLNVNVKAMLVLCQKALAVMKKKQSGHIVNVSSTVALGVPARLATYGISKLAVVGLSQALYETAKEFGVKVSIIYPGITDTKMVREARPGADPEEWMKPEDIADCILFLLKQSKRAVVKDIVPWSTRFDRI